MADDPLASAVERLAAVTAAADDARLGRAWAWGAYESEGVRFAALRACEELRELAVLVAHERARQGQAPAQAQRIAAQYRAAYRDLWAALLGLADDDLVRAPEAGEWAARQALGHLVEGEGGFLVCCSYALEQHRGGNPSPGQPPAAYWDATLGEEQAFVQVLGGPVAGVAALHAELHARALALMAGVRDEELELPSRYWEPEPMPLRFRLHRFESHLRQHTVQIDGALAAIGRAPGEGRRLARLLYAALAELEGAAVGAEGALPDARAALAASLGARADELAALLA